MTPLVGSSRRWMPAVAAVAAVSGTVLSGSPAQASTYRSAAGGSYVASVRTGHHPGFDRLVFTFHGAVPNHTVRYVNVVRADPSDKVVPLVGHAKLRVVLHPTVSSANEPQGTWTPLLPEIRQVKGAGNFEGYTSYGAGLAKREPLHVFTLTAPSRLVIDVTTP